MLMVLSYCGNSLKRDFLFPSFSETMLRDRALREINYRVYLLEMKIEQLNRAKEFVMSKLFDEVERIVDWLRQFSLSDNVSVNVYEELGFDYVTICFAGQNFTVNVKVDEKVTVTIHSPLCGYVSLTDRELSLERLVEICRSRAR